MSITMSCDPMRHDLDAIHRIVAGTNWWRNNRCARTVCGG
jgi:hypothetical protein